MSDVVFFEQEENPKAQAADQSRLHQDIMKEARLRKKQKFTDIILLIISIMILISAAALAYTSTRSIPALPANTPYSRIPKETTGKLPPAAQNILKQQRH